VAKFKAVYESEEDLPESIDPRELYVERDGKFVLDAEGVKTLVDVEKLQTALKKEREEHRGTKLKMKAFGDLTPEAVTEMQDELEELRAAPGQKGRPSDETIQKLVDARVAKEKRELEKQLKTLSEERATLLAERDELKGRDKKRRLKDTIVELTRGEKGLKIRPEALEDAELYAERMFVENEDGAFVTREGAGVEPGLSPRELFVAIQTDGKRPHWFMETQGAGAQGGRPQGGAHKGPNPFDKKTFSISEASAMMKADPIRAKRLIASAEDPSLAKQVFAAALRG